MKTKEELKIEATEIAEQFSTTVLKDLRIIVDDSTRKILVATLEILYIEGRLAKGRDQLTYIEDAKKNLFI